MTPGTMKDQPAAAGKAGAFLGWWAAELGGLFPAAAAAGRPWRVLALRGQSTLDVFVREKGGITQAARLQPGQPVSAEAASRLAALAGNNAEPGAVLLRLASDQVVVGRINVPKAAEALLEPVLRNQLERLAPWPADKALLAYEVLPPAAGADPAQLDVRVTIAGRAAVEADLAWLAALGLHPTCVDHGTAPEGDARFNLLPAPADGRARQGRRLINVLAGALAVGLTAGAYGLWAGGAKRHELDQLAERRLATERTIEAGRGADTATERQMRFASVTALKRQEPSAAVAIEALSRALPDDVTLQRLELVKGLLTIRGQAGSAASLVGRLEATGQFVEVRFAAPTTRSDDGRSETFALTAQLNPAKELQ
jgi:general secretion pathway protein L